jgi:hypothetical protein
MDQDRISIKIIDLKATVPEGLPIEWEGMNFSSGPLIVDLDDAPEAPPAVGTLDYSQRLAEVDFPVRVRFPDFAGILEDMGVPTDFTEPVKCVIKSRGSILPDHSFMLGGPAEFQRHALFTGDDLSAQVLQGY